MNIIFELIFHISNRITTTLLTTITWVVELYLRLIKRSLTIFIYSPFHYLYSFISFEIDRAISPLKPVTNNTLSFINNYKWRWIQFVVFLVSSSLLALIVAVFAYIAIYIRLMPKGSFQKPLYFDYSNSASPVPICKIPFDSSFFYPGQEYNIDIFLEVPESAKNKEIGMFMLNLLLGDQGSMYYSSKPAIIKLRSPLLEHLSTFFYALPLVLGYLEEKQTLPFRMFEHLVVENPISSAVVTLSQPIQLYSARMTVEIRLHGLRYIAYNWFWTSFFLGVLTLFWLQLIVYLSFWIFFTLTREPESLRELEKIKLFEGEEEEIIKTISPEESGDEAESFSILRRRHQQFKKGLVLDSDPNNNNDYSDEGEWMQSDDSSDDDLG